MKDSPPHSSTASVVGRTDSAVSPLTGPQRGLWFESKRTPDSSAYNVPILLRLRGVLDSAALQRALTLTVQRQGALRSQFHSTAAGPKQLIHASVRFDWTHKSLAENSEVDLESQLKAHSRTYAQQPFDLENDPMVRVVLYTLDTTDHALLLVLPHIVCDGYSVGTLLQNLSSAYDFCVASPGSSSTDTIAFSPMGQIYTQYLAHQASERADQEREHALGYWLRQLADAPMILTVGTELNYPSNKSTVDHSVRRRLPERLLRTAERFARNMDCTLFMVLFAAFNVLLQRHGAGNDLLVAIPYGGRDKSTEGLMGMLATTLLLRTDLSGSPTAEALLSQVKRTAIEGYQNTQAPFDELVAALRTANRTTGQQGPGNFPQISFDLNNSYSTGALAFSGLDTTVVEVATNAAKFDLTCSLTPTPSGLDFQLQFKSRFCSQAAAERMLEDYPAILAGLCNTGNRTIGDIRLGSAPVARKPLETNCEQSVHQLFEEQALRSATKIALRSGVDSLTYAELNNAANQFAGKVLNRTGPGACIGLHMDRHMDAVVAMLGILKAGCAYVPLPPGYPPSRLRSMASDADVAVIVSASPVDAEAIWADHEIVSSIGVHSVGAQTYAPVSVETPPEQLAYVIYTSGSTGRPNGVATPHRAIVNLVVESRFVTLDPDEVVLATAPIAFDAFTFELWWPLLHGGECVLYPDAVPLPGTLKTIIRQHKVTTLWLTASLFNAIIDESPQTLTGINQLIIGGEALSVDHVCRAQQTLPHLSIINGYGPTECTTFACAYKVPNNQNAEAPSIPIGTPLAGTEAWVLDETLNPVRVGVAGELYIGGRGLALGYINRPELTAERFISNPNGSSAARLYKTGDRAAVLDSGNIVFIGRLDEQRKIRGHRIELGEIDAVLNKLDRVSQAKTVVIGSAERQQLVSVVASPDPTPLSRELRVELAHYLPAYMLPNRIVGVNQLPLTASGKLDMKGITKLAEQETRSRGKEPDCPSTDTEKWLLGSWQQLLNVSPVSLEDDFFDLGGHSLLALKMLAQIESEYGVSLPLSVFYGARTIRALARQIDSKSPETWSPIVALRSGTKAQPLFLVHPIGGEVMGYLDFVVHMRTPRAIYGVQAAGGMRGQAPFTNLVEMASYYLAEIRSIQPKGPYLIGGLSLGGLIAYEMAVQLRCNDESVEFLFVGDSWFEKGPHISRWSWWKAGLALPFNLTPASIQALFKARQTRKVLGTTQKLPRKAATEHKSSRHQKMKQAHRQALDQYTPGKFDGRLTLYRGTEISRYLLLA